MPTKKKPGSKEKGKTKKFLVVEDDPDSKEVLESMLASAPGGKYSVVSAQSLDAAFAALTKEKFAAVLLDLNLPDSKGIDTLIRLNKRFANQLVIVISGINDAELRKHVDTFGGQDYFVKGELTKEVLLRFIETHLSKHDLKEDLNLTKEELEARNAALKEASEGVKSLSVELEEIKKQAKLAVKKAENMALLDQLTDLPNRRGMQQIVTRELMELRRGNYKVGVLLINVDRFKNVNDGFGHAVGDIVLKEIAIRIKRLLRSTDHVARIGGGEFMVLLPNIRIAESIKVAEKMRLMVSHEPIIISSSNTVPVTVTIAATELNNESATVDELLKELYPTINRSKLSGDNRVALSVQGPSSPEDAHDALSDVIELLKKGDLFYAVYHKIVRLEDNVTIGQEILSRFRTSVFTGPDDFFRICVENNMLTKVDRKCFQMCVETGKNLPDEQRQHINIFPSTLIDIPPEQIIDIFDSPDRGGKYCIEISEQQIIGDPAYLLEPIEAFKKAGIVIAIDDVGFGQSCLESLVVLEPQILKIDKSRMIGIAKSRVLQRQVERFLKIAKSLEMEVIAEGIETKEDCDMAMQIGIKYGQGYYWGIPS